MINLLIDRVTVRYKNDSITCSKQRSDFMDVSPRQIVSVATAMIPFLENDDANQSTDGS